MNQLKNIKLIKYVINLNITIYPTEIKNIDIRSTQ